MQKVNVKIFMVQGEIIALSWDDLVSKQFASNSKFMEVPGVDQGKLRIFASTPLKNYLEINGLPGQITRYLLKTTT